MEKIPQHDHLFKILLIGDAGVGKSSILLRFCDDSFDAHLGSTIGVDFKVKMMKSRGKEIKVTIWDTAGQERFRTLTSSYYRGAQAVIICYDVTRQETFDSLDQWLRELEVYSPGGGRSIVKLLIGNKIDSPSVIPRDTAESWARARGMLFMESSAKTNSGIDQAFEEVVEKIIDSPSLMANTAPSASSGTGIRVPSLSPKSRENQRCCE